MIKILIAGDDSGEPSDRSFQQGRFGSDRYSSQWAGGDPECETGAPGCDLNGYSHAKDGWSAVYKDH